MTQLTPADAQEFYAEHKGRHFFSTLLAFITEGPVVALRLVGTDAVAAVSLISGLLAGWLADCCFLP